MSHKSDGQVAGSRDSVSPSSVQEVPGRRGRLSRFVRLALALEDLHVATACLKLAGQSGEDRPAQVEHALLGAMVVAYGRLFPRARDEATGLPDLYEPIGQLRVPHLHLLGMRNLMRHHRESSSRRVHVGPARGGSIESHVAPGGRIAWMVLPDPIGPLDLQQVGALFLDLRTRVEAEAGQLLTDLFAGRPVPPRDVILEDA